MTHDVLGYMLIEGPSKGIICTRAGGYLVTMMPPAAHTKVEDSMFVLPRLHPESCIDRYHLASNALSHAAVSPDSCHGMIHTCRNLQSLQIPKLLKYHVQISWCVRTGLQAASHIVYPFGEKGDPDDGLEYMRVLERRYFDSWLLIGG